MYRGISSDALQWSIAVFIPVSFNQSQHEISAAEQGNDEVKKPAVIEQSNIVSKQAKDETNLNQENQSAVRSQETPKAAKKEAEAKSESNVEEQVDMSGKLSWTFSILEYWEDSGINFFSPFSLFSWNFFFPASMIAKIRITTEEEAKAAIAERRRLAREQAEREAELERQRQVRF